MASQKKAKIVWSLDPFVKDAELLSKVAKTLAALAAKEGAQVEPVYVLSPDAFNWTGDFSGAWVKEYMPMVKEALKKATAGLGMQLMEPKILVNRKVSLRADVKMLMDHAVRSKALWIVLTSRARTGLERWLTGSFAESLLMQAKRPVLVVNPDAKPATNLRKVLFPTDLSKESKKAFKELQKWAKKWSVEIELFHKLPDPIEPMVQAGVHMAGGGWISLEQFLAREVENAEKACKTMQADAAKSGVKLNYYIERQPGFVVDAINARAEKCGADLVFVASRAGVVSNLLIGSIARQLVRSSHIPVAVHHFKSK